MFIAFEGGDGVGKTTQVRLLAAALEQRGFAVVTCRDPGSTPLGEELRQLLLRRVEVPLTPLAESLLYMAARAQLVDEVIRPALEAGKIVISDRFLLSNVVYQGYGCGVNVDMLWHVGRWATGGILPTLIIVLDVPVALAAERRKGLPDRLEARHDDFHHRVREAFLREAARNPACRVIDAQPPPEVVHQQILGIVLEHLRRRGANGHDLPGLPVGENG